MKKTVIALSGGLDSCVLLADLFVASKDNPDALVCLSVTYGSKHNRYEDAAADRICSHFGVEQIRMDLTQIGEQLKSNLMASGGDVPDGHYAEDNNMRQTLVPGRNLIFIAVAAAVAESREFDRVSLGIRGREGHVYPDCRPLFLAHCNDTLLQSSAGKVSLFTPYANWTKTQVVERGILVNAPFHLTRTCYKDQEKSCGKCAACVERLEAFSLAGIKDPISYE